MFKELKGFGGNLFEAEFAKNVKENYASHILVKLVDFDWSFIRNEAKYYYSKTGQHAFDPVLMFKILFLKEAMNLNSDYQLEELINLHILFRFFLNVSFDDDLPDRSTIVVFRNMLVEKGLFDKAFHKIVLYAQEKGFLKDCLGGADSTVIKTTQKIDRFKNPSENIRFLTGLTMRLVRNLRVNPACRQARLAVPKIYEETATFTCPSGRRVRKGRPPKAARPGNWAAIGRPDVSSEPFQMNKSVRIFSNAARFLL